MTETTRTVYTEYIEELKCYRVTLFMQPQDKNGIEMFLVWLYAVKVHLSTVPNKHIVM